MPRQTSLSVVRKSAGRQTAGSSKYAVEEVHADEPDGEKARRANMLR